ncbi:cell division protein FtsW, partial [Candidatus Curtissbacteria bacterium]|nr:cell division protein FtsW [Candidatus Curtissbacteria bacterium]
MVAKSEFRRLHSSKFDLPLLAVTAILVLFGLLAIYDASVVSAFRDFGDKFYYFKNQLIWAS